MKKMRIALASMLVAAGITATAGAANFTNCADRLKDVGLFQGTNPGYQLDKAPTRAEASAMLVRLLGKEAEAEKLTYTGLLYTSIGLIISDIIKNILAVIVAVIQTRCV